MKNYEINLYHEHELICTTDDDYIRATTDTDAIALFIIRIADVYRRDNVDTVEKNDALTCIMMLSHSLTKHDYHVDEIDDTVYITVTR